MSKAACVPTVAAFVGVTETSSYCLIDGRFGIKGIECISVFPIGQMRTVMSVNLVGFHINHITRSCSDSIFRHAISPIEKKTMSEFYRVRRYNCEL